MTSGIADTGTSLTNRESNPMTNEQMIELLMGRYACTRDDAAMRVRIWRNLNDLAFMAKREKVK